MAGWVIWAIVAVALAIGEILTPGLFFLGPVAVAAVVAAIVAAVGAGAAVPLIVFIARALAALSPPPPIARAHPHVSPMFRTGAGALVRGKGTAGERGDAGGGRGRT